MTIVTTKNPKAPFSQVLRDWRQRKGLSQLALALISSSSQRHISFLESGRANPSREMVLGLAEAMTAPFQAQNELLLSAGFAPVFVQTSLNSQVLQEAKNAMDQIMRLHAPLPAICFDPYYNIQMANEGAAKLVEFLTPADADSAARAPFADNLIVSLAKADGIGKYVINLESLLILLIKRLDAEIFAMGNPHNAMELLDAIQGYSSVPNDWRTKSIDMVQQPFFEMRFKRDDTELSLFSTVTTFGAPGDITLQNVRLESYYPANEETRRFFLS